MKQRKRRPKRPRNPYAPLLRRLGAKRLPSVKSYRRKAKHPRRGGEGDQDGL